MNVYDENWEQLVKERFGGDEAAARQDRKGAERPLLQSARTGIARRHAGGKERTYEFSFQR